MQIVSDVLWDWNGTLMDDVLLNIEILNEFRRARGLDIVDLNHYRKHFVLPASRFCARLLDIESNPDAIQQVAREWLERYVAGWPNCALVSGAPEVIDALTGAGVRSSVLSASSERFLSVQIDHFGLRPKLSGIAGTDNILSEGKVDRGHRLMEELGARPESTLLVGDTENDLEVAVALGIRCLLVDFGHASVAHLRNECLGIACSMPEVARVVSTGHAPN